MSEDWPVVGAMNGVVISEYKGRQYKGEPIEAYRIQLTGRPGRPFLFLTATEYEGLKGIFSDPVSHGTDYPGPTMTA